VRDESGNAVSGDVSNAGFEIHALGENDQTTMVMRVKADGTYANIKLFPQLYRVWVEGPVICNDTVTVDLSGGRSEELDFLANPFITLPPPVLVGEPTDSTLEVSYTLQENNGYVADKKYLLCSTVSNPSTSTGSGPFYSTKKIKLNDLQGTVVVKDLIPGTEYFIRLAARADNVDVFNYSTQVVVSLP
jgi:hypothetical protein